MGWLDDFHGEVVGLDTAPLIYYLETNPTYLPLVDPFFAAVATGEVTVVTSTVTLVEVLVHPLRRAEPELAEQYRDVLLASEGIDLRAVSPGIAEVAARLRAMYNLRTPDAIQLATAQEAGAQYFLTNDRALARIPDMIVLVLDDLLKEGEGHTES